MRLTRWALCVAGAWSLALASGAGVSGRALDRAAWPLASAHAAPSGAVTPQVLGTTPAPDALQSPDDVVARYCRTCHNDFMMRGQLSLATFEVAKAAERADVAEKMIRKLQAGMMPPPGERRPNDASYAGLISALERTIDDAAAKNPNPGNRVFPRLNRREYERAVQDLLALEVDAGTWLPLDPMSANFDNIADEQVLSAILLEAYLNAAADISRLAVGDKRAPSLDKTYTNTSYLSQHPWDRLDGAPYGTRGGIVVDHVFPADATYVFEVTFTSGDNAHFEDVDVSIDGERVGLIRYEPGQAVGADGRGPIPMKTERVRVKAGQHKVVAAFVRRTDGPYEDLIRPHDWSFAGGGSGGAGITTLPHVRDLIIKGPFDATGVSDTPSRRRIFSCRPTSAAEERPCALAIAKRLAGEAYRRPLGEAEAGVMMQFYAEGAAQGGFEAGVRNLVEAILASPHFIFRIERRPDNVAPGAVFPVSGIEMASRLSFFLWGRPPDETLIEAATDGSLETTAGVAAQARRMLADPRAEALGPRFAAQWLRLQDVEKVHPDPNFFPNFDDNLAADMRRETETFFNDLVGQDRSVLDLYRADYTFVNERLARHYGFPGVAGSSFRKVRYPDDTRRGLLGQGSVLVQTSYANRTSPVLRGKWVMEVLLGTPPPPPPPDIPALEEIAEAREGRILTTRERLEIHRENPTCNACHRFMDPIGLALDNFDVTGKWRQREAGAPLDTLGTFYDGTTIRTPAELSAAILKRPTPLVRTFTENLMSYALGRRIEAYDQPTVRAIEKAAEAEDYRISSFIVGVVTSDAFRLRRAAEEAPQAGKAPGGRH